MLLILSYSLIKIEWLKTIEFAKVHGVTIVMSNHDFNGTPSRDVIVNRLIQMKEIFSGCTKELPLCLIQQVMY